MPCWQKWIMTGDLSVLPRERETGFKRRVLLKMAVVRSGRATQARGLPRCQLSSSSSRALLRQPCGSLGLCAGQGASQRDGLWVFFFIFATCVAAKRARCTQAHAELLLLQDGSKKAAETTKPDCNRSWRAAPQRPKTWCWDPRRAEPRSLGPGRPR